MLSPELEQGEEEDKSLKRGHGFGSSGEGKAEELE